VVSRGTEDCVSFRKPVKRILLNLEPDVFQEAFPDNGSGQGVELVAQWGVHDRQVEYTLRALEAELEAGFPGGSLFGESLLCALAVRLYQRYSATAVKNARVSNHLPRLRLNRVVEYIDSNLGREITLTSLAETAGYSRSHFLRMFRSATGQTPYHYVLESRLKRAKELMRLGHLSFIDIAAHTGFSSHAHMSRTFRQLVGVTPSEYRRNL
jgi:AraC family transcriptional regulator